MVVDVRRSVAGRGPVRRPVPESIRWPVGWEVCRAPSRPARVIVGLHPDDDRAYRQIVSRVAYDVERRLSPGVLVNRAGSARGPSMLVPWQPARRVWRRLISHALGEASECRRVLVTDVRDCYGSIHPRVVERSLCDSGVSTTDAAAVAGYVGAFRSVGVRGLPIGPDPSAVLANAVLAELDDAVALTGCRFLRWVDDVVVFAADGPMVRAAFDGLRRAADRVGLELNDGKTRMFTDLHEARTALVRSTPSRAGPSCMA